MNAEQDNDAGTRILGLTLYVIVLAVLELALQMGLGFGEFDATWGLVPALVLGLLIVPLAPPHAASALPLLAAGFFLGWTFHTWTLPAWLSICLGAAFAGPGVLKTLTRPNGRSVG